MRVKKLGLTNTHMDFQMIEYLIEFSLSRLVFTDSFLKVFEKLNHLSASGRIFIEFVI